ncbi:hypothetical protein [Streptomyces venezuelae]
MTSAPWLRAPRLLPAACALPGVAEQDPLAVFEEQVGLGPA